ncbi:M28 family peptidase [Bizionia sp. KMM 8389]
MKNTATRTLLVSFLFLSNLFFGQSDTKFSFNSDNLLAHVKELASDSYEGRRTDTRGAEKARNYIVNQLQVLDVAALVLNFEQHFSFETPNKTYKGTNILGYIKGKTEPEKYIVISAHYDHEGIKNGQIYNGADDDASGVSALFAFAEWFQNNQPNYSVILAFFDAEELGLQGSRYFVNNSIVPLKSVIFNINMDMISRNVSKELYVAGVKSHKHFQHVYGKLEPTDDIRIISGHDGTDNKQNWTYSSDHAPFFMKNIPFLYFGVEDHQDYHKPTDTYENIHPEFYAYAVENIIGFFKELDTLKF